MANKRMKRYSISLTIREIQIKTTVRYYFIPTNGLDLIEAKDIKKRWQEYTEELYKKDLHDPDNHDGIITHIEPDILECDVK